MADAGYQQYEISGYSQPQHQCQHNLNYWRFGDYLGIGCGAHGKITDIGNGQIQRTVKVKHPKGYMDLSQPYLNQLNLVEAADRPFEFLMNRLRLTEACPIEDYELYTGLELHQFEMQAKLLQAQGKGLLTITPSHWQVTDLGRRYLNSLLEMLV